MEFENILNGLSLTNSASLSDSFMSDMLKIQSILSSDYSFVSKDMLDQITSLTDNLTNMIVSGKIKADPKYVNLFDFALDLVT